MINTDNMTLGEWFNLTRLMMHKSLRAAARELDINPSYLSDIENNRRVPAEDVLMRIAKLLELNPDEVMVRAGRSGAKVDEYMRKHPEVTRLLRLLAEEQLSDRELKEVQRYIIDDLRTITP